MTYQETLDFYDKLVDQCPDFERKGKTMPYTSANGYMFSLLNKDGELGIRLDKAEQEAFMAEHDTTMFKSYGATMRGYVLIPESLYPNEKLLVDTLNAAYAHVISLPPK